MKVETIKIPKSTADMTMDHLPFFMNLAKFESVPFEQINPMQVSDMLSLFFSKPPEHFDRYTPNSNQRLFSEICASCALHQSKPIKTEVKVNSQVYKWVSDYSKVNTAFHRDISRCDFVANPLEILAFCYIEDGLEYNQLDKSQSIINPRKDRAKALKDQFTLSDYLDIQAFFLSSWSELKRHLVSRR